MFAFAKRFGWTPAQVRELDAQDIHDLMTACRYESSIEATASATRSATSGAGF